MFRQTEMLNNSTLKKDFVLLSVLRPIFWVAKKLYGLVLMLLFTAVAVVALLVSAIVAAVFAPAGKEKSSRDAVTNHLTT